jgi:hypothetical protein
MHVLRGNGKAVVQHLKHPAGDALIRSHTSRMHYSQRKRLQRIEHDWQTISHEDAERDFRQGRYQGIRLHTVQSALDGLLINNAYLLAVYLSHRV